MPSHRIVASALAFSLVLFALPVNAQQDSALDKARDALREAGEAAGMAVQELGDKASDLLKKAGEKAQGAADRAAKKIDEATRVANEKRSSAVRSAVENWTNALMDGDYERWFNAWTDDPVLMPPAHARLMGRQQIEAFVRANIPTVKRYAMTDWFVEGRGDLAVATNDLDWGGTMYKQVIVLRRVEEDWKVQIVMYNSGAGS